MMLVQFVFKGSKNKTFQLFKTITIDFIVDCDVKDMELIPLKNSEKIC
jgi:hypothetical protein